ncbi:MAG: prepilin-type N-terminal cleavage/methylation domain-containing protein [Acidobacteriota bacterium]|nr:prepilin-type N-terminal cleavage/methylation domain-containing protein [Acidobacteriota bacterium]
MRYRKEPGFSLVEALVVIAIALTIAALSVPHVISEVRAYRLNSGASALAGYGSMARMKAASQFAPFRLNIDTTSGTFSMEKLCGDTPSSSDSNCSGGVNPYSQFTIPAIELGTQYIPSGDSLLSCRPSGVSAYPGDITADAAGCPAVMQVYFNTRGVPVNNAGGPIANGGTAVYLSDGNGLVDAVTFSLGGRVAVWTWSSSSSQWLMR